MRWAGALGGACLVNRLPLTMKNEEQINESREEAAQEVILRQPPLDLRRGAGGETMLIIISCRRALRGRACGTRLTVLWVGQGRALAQGGARAGGEANARMRACTGRAPGVWHAVALRRGRATCWLEIAKYKSVRIIIHGF